MFVDEMVPKTKSLYRSNVYGSSMFVNKCARNKLNYSYRNLYLLYYYLLYICMCMYVSTYVCMYVLCMYSKYVHEVL